MRNQVIAEAVPPESFHPRSVPTDRGYRNPVIPDEAVEAVAAKAFQKHEGVKWADTSEGSRRKWRERYRAQMEAMARAEAKKATK